MVFPEAITVKRYLYLLILTGCAVGPNYKAPENKLSDAWSASEVATTQNAPVLRWWELFEDPLLNKYITLASSQNNDVLVAMSRILQARALRQITASSFFPQVGADVNATRTYFSKNGPIFAIGPSVGEVPGTVSPGTGLPFDLQVPQTQNLYNILIDASWEIDVFGKTRRMVEAAGALVDRTIDEKNDILISVMAEVARNYIELRSSQEKARLIQENIALLSQKATLVQLQFKVGYVSRLDDEQILATLAEERALLPQIEAEIHRSIYMLSVLIGTIPETLEEELIIPQPLPKIPETIAVGLRSDLLRRRPDVRRAERDLAAATANIGVAIASFFPTFTLLGDGGLQSLSLKNLFTMGSKTWALAGDITMPIFQGGKLVANLRAKRAETTAAAYTYQKTVLEALEEAESTIVAYSEKLKTRKERQDAFQHYEKLTALSHERKLRGLISLVNVLDVERQQNRAEQEVLNSSTGALLDAILLYKVLGGGWEVI